MFDPARHRCDQALKPLGIQAAIQPTMIPHLTAVETPADPALNPGPIPLAARIRHHDIAVARSTKRCVEPGDLLFQVAPFRVSRHRCEKGHRGAQPRQSDAYPMHGLRVAGAGAAVVRLTLTTQPNAIFWNAVARSRLAGLNETLRRPEALV